MVPCEVVGMIASFVCETVKGAMEKPHASAIAAMVRAYISSQFPALVSLHVVDRSEESVFLSACERLGKGFAEVFLTEEEV